MLCWSSREEIPHPWESPGKNTEVGHHFLLQGIFLTQELNLCLCIAGGFFTDQATREAIEGKNLPANAGDTGSIPGLGRSPGEGNGDPLQYSCLGNPMHREAWWATVQGVTKSQT